MELSLTLVIVITTSLVSLQAFNNPNRAPYRRRYSPGC